MFDYDPYAPESEAAAIRHKLKHNDGMVLMECFNDIEANEIRAHLSEDELKRTKFSWLYTTNPKGVKA